MSGQEARAGLALAALAALCYSSLGVWGKLAQGEGLPSMTLLFWRFALGGLGLLALGGWRARWGLRTRLVALGCGLAYTVQTGLYFAALERISAGATVLLLYLAPAFVVLYARIGGVRPSAGRLLAVGLSVAGLALIVGLPGPADRDPLGLALGVGTAAAYAAYLTLSERLLAGLEPLAATAHSALGTAIGFLGVALTLGVLRAPDGPAEWGIVAGVVTVPTLVALPALFGALRRVGAAPTAIVGTLEAVFGVLLAAVFLGEELRPAGLTGGALILAGAVLAQRPERRGAAAPA